MISNIHNLSHTRRLTCLWYSRVSGTHVFVLFTIGIISGEDGDLSSSESENDEEDAKARKYHSDTDSDLVNTTSCLPSQICYLLM